MFDPSPATGPMMAAPGAEPGADQARRLLAGAYAACLLPGGEVDALIRSVLARVVEALETPAALLCLRHGKDLVVRAHLGLTAGPAPMPPCARVVEAGRPLAIEDLATDARFAPGPGAIRRGFRSYLGVPVTCVSGEPVGSLSVLSPNPRRHSEPEIEVLSIAATRLGFELERDVRERALCEAQKLAALGHAASGFAHEVSNALTGVIGFAQLLAERPPGHDIRPDLEALVRAAERCTSTARSLLRFVRREPPRSIGFDVNRVLSEVIDLRSSVLKARGVRLEAELAPTLPAAVGDPGQIGQVFLNLLNNAVDATLETGAKGTVRVTTTVDGGRILATFEDEGPGIADPSQLFAAFYTTKAPEKGTGLGLSVSRQIVRAHGGDIAGMNLRSRGATFSVWLPAAPPSSDAGK